MKYHDGTISYDLEQNRENQKLKYKLQGFPDCCIESMLDGKSISLVIKHKINKTNLKPCIDCAIDILEGVKTLSDLIITDRRTSILGEFKEVWEKHSTFINSKKEVYEQERKKRTNTK